MKGVYFIVFFIVYGENYGMIGVEIWDILWWEDEDLCEVEGKNILL